ncbi:hypothetical protein EDC04DRAFT_2898885 [Pisolithus marmoratus]|nr:hypothetical protein EDC04DRAFT_2898885 [Pisolithus marmoratus]
MTGMLNYQANPDSAPEIANILSASGKITVAALLDQASELQQQGLLLSDEEKGKAQAKADEDCIAGEEICTKSMQTLGCCQRSENDDSSDKENINPVKKRCCVHHSTSSNEDFKKIICLMEEDMSRQDEQSKEMVSQMQETTKVFERTTEHYLEVLAQLVKN